MNSVDQLRFKFARVMNNHRGESKAEIVEHLVEFLAGAAQDPARLRVVLEVIGLEVREGYMALFDDGSFFVSNGNAMGDDDQRVLVCRVRPPTKEESA